MKSLFWLLCFVSNFAYSQWVKYPTRYDAETAAHHIIYGNMMNYLADTVEIEIEKKNGKFKSSNFSKKAAYQKIEKVFDDDFLELGERTNGGYHFTINVLDDVDDVSLNYSILFQVDVYTQKINKVIIYKE